jgi:hypothetical protein
MRRASLEASQAVCAAYPEFADLCAVFVQTAISFSDCNAIGAKAAPDDCFMITDEY